MSDKINRKDKGPRPAPTAPRHGRFGYQPTSGPRDPRPPKGGSATGPSPGRTDGSAAGPSSEKTADADKK